MVMALIDSVPDGDPETTISALLARANGQATLRSNLGNRGHFSIAATTTAPLPSLGGRPQIKSLLFFSGLAYNGEQGVSNELFSPRA